MRTALMMTVPLWLMAAAVPVLADDEAVTILATRSEKAVEDVPATVSVISDTDMDDQLVSDIKDLVRYEPGVSVRNSPARFTAAGATTGRDGNSGFNIRGLEGNRVLMTVDGIRVPDGFSFGGQNAGRGDYVGLDLLKSVEILRGPASALYGSDGIAGAVNFTTKDPGDFVKTGSVGGQLKFGRNSADDSQGGGIVLAGRRGSLSGMVAYSQRRGHEQETQGDIDAPNITRTTPNPQDIDSQSILAKLVYEPSDAHRLRLTYDRQESEVDTIAWSAVAVPPLAATSTLSLWAHDTTDRDRLSFDYRYRGDGFVKTALVAVYGQTSHSYQFASEDRNISADRTRINIFDTESLGSSVTLTSEFATGSVTHNLIYGGDWSKTTQESVRDGTVPPVGETFPTRAFPNTDYTRTGLYVQDEITAFDGKLSLFPALRFDSYELTPKPDALLTGFTASAQDGSHVSPKLGGLYRFTGNLSVFVNYAEGFKAPAPSEVNNAFANLVSNYMTLPNPDLKPETSQTWEGGLRYRNDVFSGSVTVFSAKYDDFIEQVFIGGTFTANDPAKYQYVNQSKVEIEGAEARGTLKIGERFTFDVAASTARGTNITTGSALASIDPAKLVLGLSYRAPSGNYGGGLHTTAVVRKEADRLGVTCTGGCYIPDAFAAVDLTGWWDVTEKATVRAGLFNLTNEKYAWWSDVRGLARTSTIKDAYTQPGVNGAVSLTVKF
ncbi:TonB-denpendent receptor [Asticcacaulis sp. AC460]|uniref:TonB-dependent hemoglobin/transferrin/lactoferrin family receptor n=1 Tax=Asticcacaulis sp. AC460 TaxID=1282360 RepID=UPI0003C3C389|nr:TonB-dependent hemoglobin/transferrin/lactoferrin family receptor [Asticcacaulis sp. AC460]ESQ91275.1 TonB-denpendent receptor [Asticcacaulis sp. AC460]